MVVHFSLRVKVCKPGDGGKHHPNSVIGLGIQFLERETYRGSQRQSSEVRFCRDTPCAQGHAERTEDRVSA